MKKKLPIHPIDTVFFFALFQEKARPLVAVSDGNGLFGDTFRAVWDAVGQKSNGNDPNRFDGWKGRRRRGAVVALTAASPNRTKSKNGRQIFQKNQGVAVTQEMIIFPVKYSMKTPPSQQTCQTRDAFQDDDPGHDSSETFPLFYLSLCLLTQLRCFSTISLLSNLCIFLNIHTRKEHNIKLEEATSK